MKRAVKTYTPNKAPVFAITWDPRLPNLSEIGMKHWRFMISYDAYLGKVFSEPPIVAYKRQRNIDDFLIKAKVPATPNPRPQIKL